MGGGGGDFFPILEGGGSSTSRNWKEGAAGNDATNTRGNTRETYICVQTVHSSYEGHEGDAIAACKYEYLRLRKNLPRRLKITVQNPAVERGLGRPSNASLRLECQRITTQQTQVNLRLS